MSSAPTPRDPAARRHRRLLLAFALVVVLVLVIAGGGLLRSSGPTPLKGGLAGPIATGSLVAPSGPGQTPYVTADSIPFARPTWPYVGSAPWQLQSVPKGSKVLEGYVSRPSYLPGETLQLAVSTSAPTYAVVFWRVSDRGPREPFLRMGEATHLPGRLQPAPTVDPVTRMVSAHWSYDVSFPIPPSWPSGVYLARLDSSEGVQQYVPFVIRSASAHAVLVASSALDWEAYNTWGGSSLYATTVGEPLPGVTRALAVSFDRPYDMDGGAGQLFQFELPFLLWIARQGLDVAYTTDYDLSISPDTQPMPKVVVFNGHSEYWGTRLYDWLDRHVTVSGDLGLAMLAADTGYWPVTFDSRTSDPRSFTCLKEGPVPPSMGTPGPAAEPSESPAPSNAAGSGQPSTAATPEPSEAPGSTIPPGDIEERSTSTLQAVGPNGPYVGSFADQPLFGVRYRGITDSLGRYTLAPSAGDPRLLAGTGLAPGSSLGFIAGGEVDGVYPFAEWWGPMGGAYDHLFAAALDVPGKAGHVWTAQAVWREVPSGGRVFSAGTFYWGWALDPAWGRAHAVPSSFDQLTLNILRFLGAG
jgi:hypothetical protein